MITFPSIKVNSEGIYLEGPDIHVDPSHVIAIERKENRYHSWREAQAFTTLHLSTGATINVFRDATAVAKALAARTQMTTDQ